MAEEPTRGERTRQAIITSAHDIFLENGYHGTSMRQIADRAGIAVGGIYNHFAGKEDVFVAVFEAYHPYREILPSLKAARGSSIEAYVRSAADLMISTLEQRPDFLNLMLIEIVEFDTRHIPALYQTLFPQFISVVQNFADRDQRLRDIPTGMILRVFIGLFFSYFLTEKLLGSQFPPELTENAQEYFVEIFLHGIVKEGSEE